ncbi:MAG: TrkA family potassium uptake protein [Halobacteriaceae archaeon]
MYVIVVGAGQIGSQVIDLLTAGGHDVVVLETDTEVADEIGRQYDCLMINADATVQGNLIEAGADDADAIIATTESDATNMMVLLIGKELEIPSLVSVVQNHEHMNLFRQIGANVLENPQQLIAEYLVRAMQRPSIQDFMSLEGDAEIFEITVTATAPIAEMTLEEANDAGFIGEDILIVAIERADHVVTPRGDTVIHEGDLVTVFSREGATEAVIEQFTGGAPT